MKYIKPVKEFFFFDEDSHANPSKERSWWNELDQKMQQELANKYLKNTDLKKISDEDIKTIFDGEHDSLAEGKTFKDVKKMHPKKAWDPDKKHDFRQKVKDHVKSQGLKTKQVGNDLEVMHNDDMIMQVMFRDEYVGVREKGKKFTDEFDYTELGKIKSKVSEIVKSHKEK